MTSFEDIINIKQKSEFGYLDMDGNQTVSDKDNQLVDLVRNKIIVN